MRKVSQVSRVSKARASQLCYDLASEAVRLNPSPSPSPSPSPNPHPHPSPNPHASPSPNPDPNPNQVRLNPTRVAYLGNRAASALKLGQKRHLRQAAEDSVIAYEIDPNHLF